LDQRSHDFVGNKLLDFSVTGRAALEGSCTVTADIIAAVLRAD